MALVLTALIKLLVLDIVFLAVMLALVVPARSRPSRCVRRSQTELLWLFCEPNRLRVFVLVRVADEHGSLLAARVL